MYNKFQQVMTQNCGFYIEQITQQNIMILKFYEHIRSLYDLLEMTIYYYYYYIYQGKKLLVPSYGFI